MDTIYMELSCIAAALTVGMVLMIVYDVLRLFRLFVRHAPFWTGLEDFIYWLGAGLSVFFLLRSKNAGEMRVYMIASVLIGMVFYDKTASRLLFTLLKKLRKYFKMKRN